LKFKFFAEKNPEIIAKQATGVNVPKLEVEP
jgi:hypothetical protein